MEINEQNLLLKLSQGSSRAFAELFHYYYKDLVLFAGSYVKNITESEDIVQEVFIKLWTGRKDASKISSLKAFLLKSVQNSCLDELRHQKRYSALLTLSDGHHDEYYGPSLFRWIHHGTEEYILHSELNVRLQEALIYLTSEQRKCFEMNRMQGIKQAQIAKELNIPLRTVELRIAESLKILKQQLKEYFILVVLFLLS